MTSNLNSLSEWDSLYISNRHMSVWPWSHLVSLCLRYCKIHERPLKVLEVGCGAGANIPFFLNYNCDYYGIDGSLHIVELLNRRFPTLDGKLKCGDFTQEINFDETFDLIVDRAASTHNTTCGIKNYLNIAHSKLSRDGILIITDWFSTAHQNYHDGSEVQDRYTKNDFVSGPFEGVGIVHFFDKNHISELTTNFELVHLEHSTTDVEGGTKSAVWNLVLVKR